jgi:ABC-type arginine/histidine transport system permease subunit
MSFLFDLLSSSYPRDLMDGMVVNFGIAGVALALGMALGVPLIFLQLLGRRLRSGSAALIGLMRAAPTFVVMFFLLNIIPKEFELFGMTMSLSGGLIVALSLVPYAAAYIADNGRAALEGLRRGSRDEALLLLPSLVRAYVVLVMSSSAGVAIGVNEGVAVVLRQADSFATTAEQLQVYAVGIVAFGTVFQIGFALVRLMVHLLSDRGAGAAKA